MPGYDPRICWVPERNFCMNIIRDAILTGYTSFNVEAGCQLLLVAESVDDVVDICTRYPNFMVLGKGTNILPVGKISRPILRIAFDGIEVVSESDACIAIRVAAGTVWHSFVTHAMESCWYGLEALALIPGTVGAAPVQNIGAYGSEQEQFVEQVEVLDRQTGRLEVFSKHDCKFAYRSSIFNAECRERYVVLYIIYNLSKNPFINPLYPDVQQWLDTAGITKPSPRDVYNAVVNIRMQKLPDPNVIGNAGSFFKNPVLSEQAAEDLLRRFPDLPTWRQPNGTVKIAAAYLIDRCGWKGYRIGDAGVHDRQPLVLVNYGTATGTEILQLADQIAGSVESTFGVTLEREVTVWEP